VTERSFDCRDNQAHLVQALGMGPVLQQILELESPGSLESAGLVRERVRVPGHSYAPSRL